MSHTKLPINRSPDDGRDWCYNEELSLSDVIPIALDLRDKLMPIRNQGSQGTCAAHTAACMKEYQELLDNGLNAYMSPQFIYNHRIYWNNGIQDGDDVNEDYGMTCRDIMNIMKNVGVCPEDTYPYGHKEYSKEIPQFILNVAKKYKIKGYSRIYNIEELKHAVYNNGPCMAAFPIYHFGKDMWTPTIKNQLEIGGHAMTIVGYDDEGFIIRNTWGESWGDDGYCIYPYAQWGCHWELWTMVDDKTNREVKEETLEEKKEEFINEYDPEIGSIVTDKDDKCCSCCKTC
jgi:C1A family cysteine protease